VTFTRKRGVPGLTLVRSVALNKAFVLRWRARRFKRVDKITDTFAPVYRRRDMLGALLYCACVAAGTDQIKLQDDTIESINVLRDEDTGKIRVTVRSKRGRKAT
jgi:hypothetical protein